MDDENPYTLMVNPSGEPVIGYDVSGRFLPPYETNYIVDYTTIPRLIDRKAVRDYLGDIRTTNTYNIPPTNSTLKIDLYRYLSNLNNSSLSENEKKRILEENKRILTNTAYNNELRNSNNIRTQLFTDLFGGEIERDEIPEDIYLEQVVPMYNYRTSLDTYDKLFNKLIKPTKRKIGDTKIVNKNIEKLTTQQEREAARRLQATIRRYNQLA